MTSTTSKRIALVTGANKSIGLEVARQLGKQGVHVLVGGRDEQRVDAAVKELAGEGLSVEKLLIDIASFESIDAAAKEVTSKFDKLDILVNNAAIMKEGDGPASTASPSVLTEILAVNFTGVVATTQAFLPLLRKADAASIVNVSSPLGSHGVLSDPKHQFYGYNILGYGASKSALNLFTNLLHFDLKDTKIVVNSVSPGYCKTDLNGHSGYLTAAQGAEKIVEYALQTTASNEYVEAGQSFPW